MGLAGRRETKGEAGRRVWWWGVGGGRQQTKTCQTNRRHCRGGKTAGGEKPGLRCSQVKTKRRQPGSGGGPSVLGGGSVNQPPGDSSSTQSSCSVNPSSKSWERSPGLRAGKGRRRQRILTRLPLHYGNSNRPISAISQQMCWALSCL